MPEAPATIAHALVELFRERARTLSLTQADVAARAGISQPRVSRIFAHGVVLTFEVAIAMSEAVELPLDVAYRAARVEARNRSSSE